MHAAWEGGAQDRLWTRGTATVRSGDVGRAVGRRPIYSREAATSTGAGVEGIWVLLAGGCWSALPNPWAGSTFPSTREPNPQMPVASGRGRAFSKRRRMWGTLPRRLALSAPGPAPDPSGTRGLLPHSVGAVSERFVFFLPEDLWWRCPRHPALQAHRVPVGHTRVLQLLQKHGGLVCLLSCGNRDHDLWRMEDPVLLELSWHHSYFGWQDARPLLWTRPGTSLEQPARERPGPSACTLPALSLLQGTWWLHSGAWPSAHCRDPGRALHLISTPDAVRTMWQSSWSLCKSWWEVNVSFFHIRTDNTVCLPTLNS